MSDPVFLGGRPPQWPEWADISGVTRRWLDIPYADQSPAQALDVYLPETGDGPFPVIVHIHGGGFAMGDKRDGHFGVYLWFLTKGYAVVSLNYRMSGEARFPAAVLDCRAAIRHLKVHATEYSIDPAQIVPLGGSAGGNLAAMLAMNVSNGSFPGEDDQCDAPEPTVACAIDMFGPIDFSSADAQARANGISFADHDQPDSPESRYLGAPVQQALDAARAAAPVTYLSDSMSPLLVQHGTNDRLVPYQQSLEFVERINRAGLGSRVTFMTLDRADHDDQAFSTPDNLEVIERFVSQHTGRITHD